MAGVAGILIVLAITIVAIVAVAKMVVALLPALIVAWLVLFALRATVRGLFK